jgi:hypothetical protein
MPLDTAGTIQYRKAQTADGIRFQVSPPVCNVCEREITRETFGCVYLESEEWNKARGDELFERTECTSCSPIRVAGDPLQTFLKRHNL